MGRPRTLLCDPTCAIDQPCKACQKRVYAANYRRLHTEQINNKAAAYRGRHREELRKESRRIYHRDVELTRSKARVWAGNKRKTDPYYRLGQNLRRRLHKILGVRSKSNRCQTFLGCSVQDLRRHLESKFQPGMTWENYGFTGWHVDHIMPLAAFDLTDPMQQAEAFHFTNLQPLWAKDNLRKYSKVCAGAEP